MRMSKPNLNRLFISCYFASLITFIISIYLIFSPPEKEMQLQAIYWFSIAIFCFLLPSTGPLLDRILHLRFAGIEIDLIKKTMNKAEIVFKVDEYLAAADSTTYDEDELENDIIQAPANTLTLIYAAAIDFREKNIYSVLRAANNDERNSYRRRLYRLIPIFAALTKAKKAERAMKHHYCAQLAYVYKDLPKPQWEFALENINKAIELRDQLQLGNWKFGIYEFNRLVCRLNINKSPASAICYSEEQLMEDFDSVYKDEGSRYMLFETSDAIAPGLSKWVTENRETKLRYDNWLADHVRNSKTD